MATLSEALAIAIAHRQAGRLAEAERVGRLIVEAAPDQPDAWHLLGPACAIKRVMRRPAIECLRRAIALRADEPTYYRSLADVYRNVGDMAGAAAAVYRQGLGNVPSSVELHNSLGNVLKRCGKLDEAIASYRRALEVNPTQAEIYVNLGTAYGEQGDWPRPSIVTGGPWNSIPALPRRTTTWAMPCRNRGCWRKP